MEKRFVTVEYAPISDRMWYKGCDAFIDGNQIQIGGCWFPFDDRYAVVDKPDKKKVTNFPIQAANADKMAVETFRVISDNSKCQFGHIGKIDDKDPTVFICGVCGGNFKIDK